MSLSGNKLAGGNPKDKRVENDYYATNPIAVEELLKRVDFKGSFLEPCVGEGHIANVLKEHFPNSEQYYCDIVDRGYENTIVEDFLNTDKFENIKIDNIITNPPYSLAKEFLEKSMKLISDNGKVAMFLKIQFLEGVKRIDMFKKYPPKYIYVFVKRMATFNNGKEFDANGKPWATTMCHAWFVWEKSFKGEPIIRWIY